MSNKLTSQTILNSVANPSMHSFIDLNYDFPLRGTIHTYEIPSLILIIMIINIIA